MANRSRLTPPLCGSDRPPLSSRSSEPLCSSLSSTECCRHKHSSEGLNSILLMISLHLSWTNSVLKLSSQCVCVWTRWDLANIKRQEENHTQAFRQPHTGGYIKVQEHGARGSSCLVLMRSWSGYSEQRVTFDPSSLGAYFGAVSSVCIRKYEPRRLTQTDIF